MQELVGKNVLLYLRDRNLQLHVDSYDIKSIFSLVGRGYMRLPRLGGGWEQRFDDREFHVNQLEIAAYAVLEDI